MLAERSIVSLLRRFVEAVIFLFVTLFVLHGLGVDVSTALAGVGIGGLALGLGAQKTFENMFGGVSILFDKVIQIGDPCKINNQMGTVEDIGLRSTRLRTPERTSVDDPERDDGHGYNRKSAISRQVSVPADDTVALRPFPGPRAICAGRDTADYFWTIRRWKTPRRGLNSYDLQTTRWKWRFMRTSWNRTMRSYLKSQEALLLRIMEKLEQYGVVVALPTQTTFVPQDSWIDPRKAQTLKAAIEKSKVEKAEKPGKPIPEEES